MNPTRKILAALTCAGLCASFLLASAASAQDAGAAISRAQKTLDAIDRLIDGILARQRGTAAANNGGLAQPTGDGWKSLFDGQSLAGWKQTVFGGDGDVRVEKIFRGGPPAIVVEMGASLSGFNWVGDVPRTRYEISLEAMKIDGSDFICGLTFPVGNSYASLILGGWGGGVVGISSIDNRDASENDTTKYRHFPKGQWFKIRLRVTPEKLEAWLEDEKIVNQDITGKKISLRPGDIMRSVPLGITTYQTSAAFRNIKLRRLDAQ